MTALQWGRDHEQEALEEYCETLIEFIMCRIDKCEYLPDGIVVDTDDHPVRRSVPSMLLIKQLSRTAMKSMNTIFKCTVK